MNKNHDLLKMKTQIQLYTMHNFVVNLMHIKVNLTHALYLEQLNTSLPITDWLIKLPVSNKA